jgi:poly-gamma-glutamate synthesis protein (capsule biosynthesis protein)
MNGANVNLPPASQIIWRSGAPAREIVTRVAIAGDFLPAGRLPTPSHSRWSERAALLASHFADTSTAFANLECAVEIEGLPPRKLNGIGQIVSASPEALDYLHAIGCTAVGLANNHAYDFGSEGLDRTRAAITQSGMLPVGAGGTLKSSPQIFMWEGPGNVRVGFWSAAKAAHDLATRGSAGVEPATPARAAEAVARMHRSEATVRIALIHAGCLRTNQPDPEDVALLREIAHTGFDIVAASHSHRISGCEFVRCDSGEPSFCFFGLGSLVSGYVAHPLEREGLIVVVALDAGGRPCEVEVRAVHLSGNGIGEVPGPEMADAILRRFESLSSDIATGGYVRRFYEDVSRGLVSLYLRDAHAAFAQSGVTGLMRKATRVRLRHVKRLFYRVSAR